MCLVRTFSLPTQDFGVVEGTCGARYIYLISCIYPLPFTNSLLVSPAANTSLPSSLFQTSASAATSVRLLRGGPLARRL